MSKGAYIVIEGISGTGKSTLAQMLASELQASNMPVLAIGSDKMPTDITAQTIARLIDDPRYPINSTAEVLLYNAARAQSLEVIRRSVETGVTCIVEHSYLSTLVHEYYGQGHISDYNAANEIIGFAAADLQPDLTIVLDTPVSIAVGRLSKTAEKPDEAYLERVRAGFLWEAKQRNIPVVYATDPVEAVFKHLQSHVSSVITTLQPKSNDTSLKHEVQSVAEVLAAHPTSAKVASVEPPLLSLPNPSKPTIAETEKPMVAGAAKQSQSAHYTIVKQASVFAQQQIKQTHNIGYSEQFTQTHFDHKNEHGRYEYHTPAGIQGALRDTYAQTMSQIFDTYARLVTELTAHLRSTSDTPTTKRNSTWRTATKTAARDILRPLLPVAARSSMSIRASSQALNAIITQLQSSPLPEVSKIGRQILDETSKTTLVSSRKDTSSATAPVPIKLLANKLLPSTHASNTDPVTLVQYTPRNELDVVADMLYEYSDLPLYDLRRELSNWPYARKLEVFTAYAGEHSRSVGQALEAITYSFDLIGEYDVLCSLQQPDFVTSSLVSQQLTPRLGYDTPAEVEAAGLSDTFAECFDLSLGLYSKLQAAGNQFEAQYATLLGHKTRCKVSYNAREMFRFYNLYSKSKQPSYRKLSLEMQAKIAEVHPLLAEVMSPTS